VKIRHALVVMVLLVSGFGIFGPGIGPATAQEENVPTAALVEGTCRAPGNTVAELNELRVRDEGDVLASFTTVDASLDDILGSEHAVVLTDGGDVVACGNRFGTGGDVDVAVPATTPRAGAESPGSTPGTAGRRSRCSWRRDWAGPASPRASRPPNRRKSRRCRRAMTTTRRPCPLGTTTV